jgi:myo-inositol-1(or 4)-monophosphatase
LTDYLDTAVAMVRSAGQHALACLGQSTSIEYKGAINPVTEVDKHNESVMVGMVRERYPDHAIVAEEGSGEAKESRFCWYIDPLDGTVNWTHGLPWFSASAGLLVDGVAEAGAIYVPATDELYTAGRGQGAFCNGQRLRVSEERELRRAVLGTGFPYDVASRVDDILAPLRVFLQRAQGVRRTGSACLDLCMVAAGRYDGFWELGLSVWDVAAGFLVVQEAGGRVSDFSGRPGALLTDQVLVSNGHLHDALLACFTQL